MSGAGHEVVFDISADTAKYYREQLRVGRWVSTGVFAFFLSLIIVGLATTGPNIQPLALYLVLALLAGAFGFGAFVYAIPGPVELRVSPGSIAFRFKGGRVERIQTRPLRTRIRLIERTAPPTAARFRIENELEHSVQIGIKRVPLTSVALETVSRELTESGISPVQIKKANPHVGSWLTQDFRQAR